MLEKAKTLAYSSHQGQLYGDLSYTVHLEDVASIIDEIFDELLRDDRFYEYKQYIFELRNVLKSAAYLHDILEDQGHACSYGDLKKKFDFNFPTSVADIVYACTAEKGRNRDERFNDKFYQVLRDTPFGAVVKHADRIDNMRFSKENNRSMYFKYLTERNNFVIKSSYSDERAINEVEALLLKITVRILKEFE